MSIVDQLLEKYQDKVEQSTTHPLTNELCEGTLADYRLFTYLTQDLKFFQIGLNLFGKVLSYCDDAESSIVLAKQIGFLSNDENDYFFKSLSQLKEENLAQLESKASKMLLKEPVTLPEVQSYIDLLTDLTFNSTSYVELITFMYVMEKVYLGWAEHNLAGNTIPKDLAYKYNEWIVLHSGPDFTKWTKFLEDEVVRVVKTEQDKRICEEMFVKALDLEISFFTACYNYSEN
ncbi:transcription regulator [Scheffersomyces xylosifermentans]|uniref:transcription regulator n=1 Tax=Scheffersomyces xylosifermentans TaxID=1304137 RepID=UPI00315CEDE1